MAGVQISKSKEVRARLHHPVIDSDGHTVEFEPAVMDTLREIGGPGIVERYKTKRTEGPTASSGGMLNWHRLTPHERHDQRLTVPPWWALPARNTLDRATSMLPKLLYERLDDFGLDVSILYPTFGLLAPHLEDQRSVWPPVALLIRTTLRSFKNITIVSSRSPSFDAYPAGGDCRARPCGGNAGNENGDVSRACGSSDSSCPTYFFGSGSVFVLAGYLLSR